jgi:hypothetical protein
MCGLSFNDPNLHGDASMITYQSQHTGWEVWGMDRY